MFFAGLLVLLGCKDSPEEYSHTRENELAARSVDFRTTYDARDGKAYRIVSVGGWLKILIFRRKIAGATAIAVNIAVCMVAFIAGEMS